MSVSVVDDILSGEREPAGIRFTCQRQGLVAEIDLGIVGNLRPVAARIGPVDLSESKRTELAHVHAGPRRLERIRRKSCVRGQRYTADDCNDTPSSHYFASKYRK